MKEMLPHISKNVEEVLGSLGFFLPELLLGAHFLLLILADLLLGRRYKNGSPIIALAGVLIITLITCCQVEDAGKVFFGGLLHLSVLALLLKVLFGLGSVLFSTFAVRHIRIRHNEKGRGDLFCLLV